MKWVALVLLLTNLAYFGFQMSRSVPVAVEVTSPAALQHDTRIQLYSEVADKSDERKLEMEEIIENAILVTRSSQEVTAPEEKPPEDEPPVDKPSVDKPSFDKPSFDKLCTKIGAFPDVMAAQDASERLNALGTPVVLQAVDQPAGDNDYRVVLPPANSLQEAFRRLRELKSRNIDSYVITQGDDALGISLGVFSTREAAAKHQSDLKSNGYQVGIKEIARVHREFWLYTQDPNAEVSEETNGAISKTYPNVSFMTQKCAAEKKM